MHQGNDAGGTLTPTIFTGTVPPWLVEHILANRLLLIRVPLDSVTSYILSDHHYRHHPTHHCHHLHHHRAASHHFHPHAGYHFRRCRR